jgi:hypothetical protein
VICNMFDVNQFWWSCCHSLFSSFGVCFIRHVLSLACTFYASWLVLLSFSCCFIMPVYIVQITWPIYVMSNILHFTSTMHILWRHCFLYWAAFYDLMHCLCYLNCIYSQLKFMSWLCGISCCCKSQTWKIKVESQTRPLSA